MQLYLKVYILCLTPLVQHNFAQNSISLWYAQRLSGRVNNEQLATNTKQRTINTIYNNSRFRANLATVRLAVVTHITLATFCARMMRPTIAELAFNPALARTTIAIGLAAHKTIPLLFGCRVSWPHDVRRLLLIETRWAAVVLFWAREAVNPVAVALFTLAALLSSSNLLYGEDVNAELVTCIKQIKEMYLIYQYFVSVCTENVDPFNYVLQHNYICL